MKINFFYFYFYYLQIEETSDHGWMGLEEDKIWFPESIIISFPPSNERKRHKSFSSNGHSNNIFSLEILSKVITKIKIRTLK